MTLQQDAREKRNAWSRKNYYESDHIKEYQKMYRKTHATEMLEYGRKYREANREKLKAASRNSYHKNKDKYKERNREYARKYREANKNKLETSRLLRRNEINAYAAKYRVDVRTEVFELLGGARCVECGCEDTRVLDVNHIKCDGGRWRKSNPAKKSGVAFYRAVLSGEVDKDNLNVLCRVCNQAHFIEFKYGIKYIIKRGTQHG